MINAEIEYLNVLDRILSEGVKKPNRTGIDSISLFASTIRHDYSEGFPLFTTKKMFVKGILHELLWFLKGTDDAAYLLENDVHIWDDWMVERDGKKVLPHTYGVKWRNFYGVDQMQRVIDGIRSNPDSRRFVVSAWDAGNLDKTALPWCHMMFVFYLDQDKYKPPDKQIDDGKLGDISIAVFQRSADFFLGVPFNCASYSFLLYMVAEVVAYRPKAMQYTFVDAHVYMNHVDQCMLQLTRKPFPLPFVKLNHHDSIDDFVYDDFIIENYHYYPTIKGDVAV